MRLGVVWTLVACSMLSTTAGAQRRASRAPRTRTVTSAVCAADLGKGTKTGREFCDVVISTKAADGILMKIPRHRGATHLSFDLYNRFAVPPASVRPVVAFSRQTARVRVLDQRGRTVGRGIAVGEFRTAADLFDRLSGGAGPAGLKLVAPGPAAPVVVTLPSAVSSIGIVGEQLDVVSRLGSQTFDTPGRPIAIASGFKIEYTP